TFAHAIEKSSHQFNHGEAVAIGMVAAADVAYKSGHLSLADRNRIEKTIALMGFAMSSGIDNKILFEALKSDKKRNNLSIDFVIPTVIGDCKIVNMFFDELSEYL
ncbi:MAG: 3-dehydroquinate synthase, partial [Rikenellaceae bacterium]